jgi:uncharacterized protein YfeS
MSLTTKTKRLLSLGVAIGGPEIAESPTLFIILAIRRFLLTAERATQSSTGGTMVITLTVPGSISTVERQGWNVEFDRAESVVFANLFVPPEMRWPHKPQRIAFPHVNEPTPEQRHSLGEYLFGAVRAVVEEARLGFDAAGIEFRYVEAVNVIDQAEHNFSVEVKGTETSKGSVVPSKDPDKFEQPICSALTSSCWDAGAPVQGLSPFAASARNMLPDDFFWECANEYGPVGNDDGADVLNAYRRWRKRNNPIGRNDFFGRFLRSWGLPSDGWQSINSRQLNEQSDFINQHIYRSANRAMIAFAFVQIMVDGNLDRDIRDKALVAIARQKKIAELDAIKYRSGMAALADRIAELERMSHLLSVL